jgi:hypothetical protein
VMDIDTWTEGGGKLRYVHSDGLALLAEEHALASLLPTFPNINKALRFRRTTGLWRVPRLLKRGENPLQFPGFEGASGHLAIDTITRRKSQDPLLEVRWLSQGLPHLAPKIGAATRGLSIITSMHDGVSLAANARIWAKVRLDDGTAVALPLIPDSRVVKGKRVAKRLVVSRRAFPLGTQWRGRDVLMLPLASINRLPRPKPLCMTRAGIKAAREEVERENYRKWLLGIYPRPSRPRRRRRRRR